MRRETREIRNAYDCTTYGTVIANVTRSSLSVLKADMKSSNTVTDGLSKGLTIEKCVSRNGRQEKENE